MRVVLGDRERRSTRERPTDVLMATTGAQMRCRPPYAWRVAPRIAPPERCAPIVDSSRVPVVLEGLWVKEGRRGRRGRRGGALGKKSECGGGSLRVTRLGTSSKARASPRVTKELLQLPILRPIKHPPIHLSNYLPHPDTVRRRCGRYARSQRPSLTPMVCNPLDTLHRGAADNHV